MVGYALPAAVTVAVHVAHAGLVLVGALVVTVLLAPGPRRQRAAMAELRQAAADGNLVALAELRARRAADPGTRAGRRQSSLLVTAVVASLVASAVHVAVCPEHFREATRFGVFFVVAATAQTVWAVLVARRPSRLLLLLGAIGNAEIILLWVITRTVGLPWHLSEVESIGALDVVATVAEAVACLCCLWLAGIRLRLPVSTLTRGHA